MNFSTLRIRGLELPTKVVAPVALVVVVVLLSPLWLQHVPFFQLRQIEVTGARYLTAEGVVRQLRLPDDFNVFSDLDDLKRSIELIPGVVSASVHRTLPAALQLHIVERQPVALYSSEGGFFPVDRDGRRLPYDPTAVEIDLPVVSEPEVELIGTAASVREAAPELFRLVRSIRFSEAREVIVAAEGFEILFRTVPGWDRVSQVANVLGYLGEQNHTFSRIDARYDGSIVVRS